MKGMPTIPGKDPEIMSGGEIAIVKRREKLNELLQHGALLQTGLSVLSVKSSASRRKLSKQKRYQGTY